MPLKRKKTIEMYTSVNKKIKESNNINGQIEDGSYSSDID